MEEEQWVYEDGRGLVFKKITYSPGLYKVSRL